MKIRGKAGIILLVVAVLMTIYPALNISFTTAMQIVCPIQMGFILWIAINDELP